MMLSRIAESMFWIGRYVERADDQARVLEVNLETDAAASDSGNFGAELCRAMGATVDDLPQFGEVWQVLGIDPRSSLSMVTALANCRESARRSREIISTSAWEVINRSFRNVQSGRLARIRPALACREVKDACAMIVGSLHLTMTRDDAWHFMLAGRTLERLNMTSRVLYASIVAPERPTHHHAVLEACGAQQAFVMTRGRDDTLASAIDFLLRDRLCPRSMFFSMTQARVSLGTLMPEAQRTGVEDRALRILGQACAMLEFADADDLLENLGDTVLRLQQVSSEATRALTSRYFEGALASQWHKR